MTEVCHIPVPSTALLGYETARPLEWLVTASCFTCRSDDSLGPLHISFRKICGKKQQTTIRKVPTKSANGLIAGALSDSGNLHLNGLESAQDTSKV